MEYLFYSYSYLRMNEAKCVIVGVYLIYIYYDGVNV